MRRSLVLLWVVMCEGCLVPPPPDLKDPEQTKPFVIARLVEPPLGQVIQHALTLGSPALPLTLSVQSEDKGEPVALALHERHVDEQTGMERTRYVTNRVMPAASWSDGPRHVTIEWAPQPSPSNYDCHQLTVLLAHIDSFDQDADWTVPEEFAKTDLATVSWLVNVFDPIDGISNFLMGCPVQDPAEVSDSE